MLTNAKTGLIAMVVAVLVCTAWATTGAGTEVPSMRTEYSRTSVQADGQYTTEVYATPIHIQGPSGGWVPMDVDSVRNCYPQPLPNWTGNVKFQNSNYDKISGDLYFRGGQAASHDKRQAWAKFDLSPIPDGATLTTAYFWYYCYSTGGQPSTYVRLLTSDPGIATAVTLWNEITTGTMVTGFYGHGQGWQVRALNATGVAAVQSRLRDDWIALGLHEWETNNNIWGMAYGFGGGPGMEYKPYISVTYSPPPVTDVAAIDVISPTGTVDTGEVIPMGRWRNNQAHPEGFTAYLFMQAPRGTRVYRESLTVASIGAMRETTLIFPKTILVASDSGTWTVRCSTYAPNDINPDNDYVSETFRLQVRVPGLDIGVIEIISPALWIDTNTTIIPSARLVNNSLRSADFITYLALENTSKARLYFRIAPVAGLAPAAETVVTFPEFNVGTDTGKWSVRCSLYTSSDTNPVNDVKDGTFTVFVTVPQWQPGWQEVKPVPGEPSGKDVKDGGWLTIDQTTGLIYAAKGNNTGDFYCYSVTDDTWHRLSPLKEGREAKMPKKGAVGAADGNGHVYSVKGSNTCGFWRYDIMGDSWSQLADIPLGGTNKKVKGGSDLACVSLDGTGFVYLLKGYKNEFYRFNTASDSWEGLKEAPAGANLKWDKGSWLAYDNASTLYAHKAKKHELWAYDLVAGAWGTTQLKGMPYANRRGTTKKSKDGGAGAWFDGSLYALKGGNTCEFWRYYVDGDSWAEQETMPQVGSTGKKKRVKGGGDLVSIGDGRFHALKGSKTREFWRYFLWDVEHSCNGPAATSVAMPWSARLSLWPNPTRDLASVSYTLPGIASARLDVLNAAGQIVYSRNVTNARFGTVPVSGLRPGVYLVRMSSLDRTVAGKLVVER